MSLEWHPAKNRSLMALCEHPDCKAPRSNVPRRATGTLTAIGYPLGRYCRQHRAEMEAIYNSGLTS